MIQYTQSNTSPGNCWQTAVACILGIEPDLLPDQVSIDAAGGKMPEYKGRPIPADARVYPTYHNVLNTYLVQHHKCIYTELYDWQFQSLRVTSFEGYHLLMGPTVRTAENGYQHAIVGKYGEPVWDPHPSRAGLLAIERWGYLTPTTESNYRQRLRASPCLCPACWPEIVP